jgi:hypothetical protein
MTIRHVLAAARAAFAPLLLLTAATPALAEMSPTVARSAGSVFAAATACEQHGRIDEGTTKALRTKLDPYLSSRSRQWIEKGFAEGEHKSSVLVVGHGWKPIATDETACARIRDVLNDYSIQIDGN